METILQTHEINCKKNFGKNLITYLKFFYEFLTIKEKRSLRNSCKLTRLFIHTQYQ